MFGLHALLSMTPSHSSSHRNCILPAAHHHYHELTIVSAGAECSTPFYVYLLYYINPGVGCVGTAKLLK